MDRDRQLAAAGRLAARVYTWDGPWVSLGMSQSPDRDVLPSSNVQTVMRPTGGRAVLHGHDVTVGLFAPLSALAGPGEDLSRSVRKVYRRVISPVLRALCAVGVETQLGEDTAWGRSTPRSSDCFAHVSANDLVDPATGFKRCGCALKLSMEGVLVQASIPAAPPLVDPASVFRVAATVHWANLHAVDFARALTEQLQELVPTSR
ncbi:MAG TPA: hypothetical protein PLO61_02440 [Fimbriimonadaceae bacterium]|nr:hypothetical protein [Fimbriimonadaceae bacterium]HRJ31967.1 hypothetical protein [Fimbriimonadaceae bacterium]